MWSHWVARTNDSHQPFANFDEARRSWLTLKRIFPEKMFAILMPNHLHLVVPHIEPTTVLERIQGWAGSISRRTHHPKLWQPIPDPKPIADRGYLLRTLRYVALNPCRKQLCRDPLEWYWSTYREMFGATLSQTDYAARIAKALGKDRSGFAAWFYEYVSSDAAVRSSGLNLPRRCAPSLLPQYSLREILDASSAALRVKSTDVLRRGKLRPLFIHLAMRQGWNRASLLAGLAQMSRNAVRREMLRPEPPGIDAAALCLADSRLRSERLFLPPGQRTKSVR